MTDAQTILSEFDDGKPPRDGGPTPETNADDIQHLISVVESLTDQVGTLAEQVEQQDSTTSIDSKPNDAERMYQ